MSFVVYLWPLAKCELCHVLGGDARALILTLAAIGLRCPPTM